MPPAETPTMPEAQPQPERRQAGAPTLDESGTHAGDTRNALRGRRPARINPQHLPTPPAVFGEETFTDPRQPDVEVYVRLGYVTDSGFGLSIDERTDQLVEAYVTGRNGGPKATSPRFGGRSVDMSPAMCRILAGLEKMNALGDPEGKYTFDDWCAFSINMPDVFNGASRLARSVMNEALGVKKNASKAGADSEPDSPSTSDSVILNSSSEPTPSPSEPIAP